MDTLPQCIYLPIQNKNLEVTVTKSENFNFGESLQSVYPLLDIVFSYLKNVDLNNVSLVSKEWKTVALREKQKRCMISWVYCKLEKPALLQISKNLHYNNIEMGILVRGKKGYGLDKYVCVHYDNKDHNNKSAKMTFAECLSREVFTSPTDYCVLSCPDAKPFFSVHEEHILTTGDTQKTFAGILLPHIPNIRICMFHLDPEDPDSAVNKLKPNELIKCLLVFYIIKPKKHGARALQSILKSQKPESVALAGGAVNGIKTFFKHKEANPRIFYRKQLFCIGFFQNQNTDVDFSCSSIVVTGEDIAEDEFEQKLQKLKLRTRMRTNNVGLRICCNAKQGIKRYETEIFHKVFPKTLLLGLEANGELGWDSFDISEENNGSTCPKKQKTAGFPQIFHEWSTIFLLLTWGKLHRSNISV